MGKIEIPYYKTQMQILTQQLERHKNGEITDKALNATSKAVETGINGIVAFIKYESLLLERQRFESKYLPLLNKLGQEKKILNPESGYWDSLITVKQHIIQYLKTIEGPHNMMPSPHELEEANLQPLIDAIYNHGGFEEVAHKLGLRFNGQPLINQINS